MRKIIIYIDGGARNNPGPAALGVVFCNEKGQIFKKYAHFLGERTNNEAEYEAAIFALKKIKALLGGRLAKESEIELRSDSEFLIKQLKGEYKVLDPAIQNLFLQLWNLKTDFPKLKLRLIPREKNKEADLLVNEVLDSHQKTKTLL